MQTVLLAERDKAATLEAGHAADRAQAQALIETERAASAKTKAELDEMIRQLQTRVQHAGQELASYHTQVEGLQAERAALLVQIAQLREARTDLEGYYDHAKQFSDQVDVLTTDLGGLQHALQIAQAEAAERAQHVTWLEEEIGRIHRSRSYRLTTPLRKLRKTIS
jgi:chromosome segregation ATPase